MSNRQLGDEFAYVLDRKVQTRFTGNSLEKPSLFIKRNFISDTTMETQVIGQGAAHKLEVIRNAQQSPTYRHERERDRDRNISRSRSRSRSRSSSQTPPNNEIFDMDLSYALKCDEMEVFDRDRSYSLDRKKVYAPKKCMKQMATKSAVVDGFQFNEYYHNVNQTPINAHLNFLKNPCSIIYNLTPNKNGLIEFDANFQKYSAVQIIVKTASQHNVSVFNLNHLVNREVETRDLRQKTNLQKGKYYSIFRNTQKIMKGQKCQIDDITSTEYSIIDSLNKVFDSQIELSRFQGTFTDYQSSKGYTDEWEFLKKWDTLSQTEKISKYNSNISHELNFFIYMKDKTFFETIVRNHLQNKLELTLVDLFLLDRYDDLLNKYYHVEILERINPFEITLMIFSLSIKNEQEKAQKLLDYLSSSGKQNVSDKDIQKKYFEIILNKQQEKSQNKSIQNINKQSNPSYLLLSRAQQQSNFEQDDNDNCSESFEGSDKDDQFDDNEDEADDDGDSYSSGSEEDKNRPTKKGGKGFMGGKMKIMRNSNNNNNNNNMDRRKEYDFKPINQQYKQQRQLFISSVQGLKKTGQYCERHYLNQKNDHFYGREQMQPNQFWYELAQTIIQTQSFSNFLSSKFIESNRNHTEMVIVLSLLNLPFNSPSHNQYSLQGKDQVIQAADNLLLFTKEIKETSSELKSSIMINQRFFDPQDKFEISGDEKFEKDVSEYVINYIYGCQVIVTNCTGGQQEIQVLTEVPEGSIPVHTIEYTKSYTQKLDSYSTKIFEFYFYFPQQGSYTIYPANVSKNGQVLCVARDSNFEVKKEPTKIQLNTLNQVLTQGTKEDILIFLKEKDWQDSNQQSEFRSTFQSIVKMCSDKDFYLKLLVIMREKNFFHFDIWKYSLLHLDHNSMIEFINSSQIRQKIAKYISHLNCSLIKQSLNIGEWNRIYEYYPLINSRVHLLKRDSANILNVQFQRTYFHFLQYTVEKGLKNLSGTDRLVFVYYLLLQDRVETAIEQFDKIYEADITSKQGSIQYDYVKAYLDFYKGYPNFKVAREVIEKYLDYPITQWRNHFYDMANQLAEYDGEDMIDEELKNLNISGEIQKKDDKVQSEKQQVLSVRFDEKKIIIEHKNIAKELTLTYYKIDLEVFFSKKPFLSNISEDFSYLQPTFTQKVSLNDEDKNQTAPSISKFDMPEQLQTISGPFIKAGVTYFSTQLKVSLFSDEAQLKITDQNNEQLSKIYVKVFSKNKAGKIDFIKDGYTDLRGRFDYLLSSSVNINDIDRLSIFIMSDDHGSLILEAKPPKRIGQFTETIELKSKNWNLRYQEKVQKKCKK